MAVARVLLVIGSVAAVASKEATTCSLFAIKGDTCGQSDLDCKFAPFAKLAEKSLAEGTCADKGYTVKGKTSTRSYPVVGDIVITEYTKPSSFVEAGTTCSLFAIKGDTCGQSDLDCKFAPYAKLAEKSLAEGTCADKGYTVKGKSTTKSYPIVGDIVITEYTKPASFVEAGATCSLFAIKGDTCGQSDLDCKFAPYAKLAEKSLAEGTCTDKGYTVKGKSTTKSYPVVGDIVITEYTKPASFVEAGTTCSLFAIKGDTCGQSDLDCKFAPYAKLAEKSLVEGTCADKGYTVKGKSTTKSYPVVGDIVITEYTKKADTIIV